MSPQGADRSPAARWGDGCRPGFQLYVPYRWCDLRRQLLGLVCASVQRRTEAWVGAEARGRDQVYSPTLLSAQAAPGAWEPSKGVALGPWSTKTFHREDVRQGQMP